MNKRQALIAGALTTLCIPTEVASAADVDAGERPVPYRGNLAADWSKALRAAYPVLQALVGEEFFDGLAHAYGKERPSTSGDLDRFGEHFARFLAVFPPARPYSYFPDMARLEWLCHRNHFAADMPGLSSAELTALAPAQLESARLVFNSRCHLFASDWAVVQLWQAHQPGAQVAFPSEMATPSLAMVVRPQGKSEVLALSEAAYGALRLLQQGESFGTALDAAFEIEPGFDIGANLQAWRQAGVFACLLAAAPVGRG